MRKHFSEELDELKERVVYMGGLVETAIHRCMRALTEHDPSEAEKVIQGIEPEINALEVELDERALRLFALQQPLAMDLRFLAAVVKINNNLERMGDLAVNICQAVPHLLEQAFARPLVDLPLMAARTETMVRHALDALMTRNVELAREVLETDDEVDATRDQIFRDLLGKMLQDPSIVERALSLILVARNLERIADHATNIAEEVIFWVEGVDVRHHREERGVREGAAAPEHRG